MTFGSLFSGAGGLDLGLERAGMKCRWQVEINPFCRKVLAKHWPHVRRVADIRDFRVMVLDAPEWSVDLIAGGFPCKQTSVAAAVHGRRSGLDGDDSGLWHEQLAIIRRILPRWAVVENVSGVATWGEEITRSLEGTGYTVSPLPLSALDLGAPHRRGRMFFVANLDGKGLEITWAPGSPEAEFVARRAAAGNPWHANLAGIRGMDDGLPAGLDRRERIVALGNAVLPPMGELIGHLILEAERCPSTTS